MRIHLPTRLDEVVWRLSGSGIYHVIVGKDPTAGEMTPLCRPGSRLNMHTPGMAPQLNRALSDDQARLRRNRGTIRVCDRCLDKRKRAGFFERNARLNRRTRRESTSTKNPRQNRRGRD